MPRRFRTHFDFGHEKGASSTCNKAVGELCERFDISEPPRGTPTERFAAVVDEIEAKVACLRQRASRAEATCQRLSAESEQARHRETQLQGAVVASGRNAAREVELMRRSQTTSTTRLIEHRDRWEADYWEVADMLATTERELEDTRSALASARTEISDLKQRKERWHFPWHPRLDQGSRGATH